MKKFVAYYRVSTQRQGQSGLGLESQQASVATFASGQGVIVREYTEIESGKKNNRTQLLAAIEEAKAADATLLIAKLDRLSRDIRFIFELRDSGVKFQACDIPEANTLTIGIFAVMAQHEREVISKRTKDALAAKRARGEALGNLNNFTTEGRNKGRESIQRNAKESKANVQAAGIVKLMKASNTLQGIANHLNTLGYQTRKGKQFTPTAVRRLSLSMQVTPG